MKKFLSLVLTALMVFSMLPMSIFATETAADALPNAEVKELGAITVGGDGNEYYIYNLNGGGTTLDSEPFVLPVTMQFTALDSAEKAAENAYGDYYTDFFITLSGFEGDELDVTGCYIAGYYPSYELWVKIPLKNFSVENGVSYPVIAAAGHYFTYEMICADVQTFVCGMYLTPEIIEENPNLNVNLALGLCEDKDAVNNAKFVEVGSYDYVTAIPNAQVANLGAVTVGSSKEADYTVDSYYVYDLVGNQSLTSSSEEFEMQIAMQFVAKDSAAKAARNFYGNYTTDFFVEINGLATDSFVANGCYLAGFYESYEAWVKIPLDGFTINNGAVYPVITAVGHDFSYVDICSDVKNFVCGIYFTPEVLAANPDMDVTLHLGLSENIDKALACNFVSVDSYTYDVSDLAGYVVKVENETVSEIIANHDGVAAEAVEEIVADIQTNAALEDFVPENLPEEIKLVLTLVDMGVTVEETVVATTITYDVAPMQGGEKVTEFAEPITFRLPVPNSVTAPAAKVYHEDDLMGTFAVQTENGAKFVEVTSDTFSPYTVEFTDVLPCVTVNGVEYGTIAAALAAAKANGTTDLVITIIGENTKETADDFGMYEETGFNSVTIKQNNGGKAYYIDCVYTGKRTSTDGQFVFDGVNLVITGQFISQCSTVLKNNAVVTRTDDTKNFIYYADVVIEPGSQYFSQIDDILGGSIVVDGGHTDGAYDETPGFRSIYFTVRAGQTFVAKDGAYVLINAANEIGNITLDGNAIVSASKVDVLNNIAIGANGCLTVDTESVITANTISGNGKIVIDAANYIAGAACPIVAKATGFTGTIEVVNATGIAAEIDENGNIVFVEVAVPVAKIGDACYATLAEAVAAAQNGDKIVMVADVVLDATVTIPAGKTVTLDLAGKTVSQVKAQNGNYEMILNDGNLTIMDSVGDGKLSYTDSGNGGDYVSNTITNRGTITVQGGTIENLSSATVANNGYPYAIDTSIWGAAKEVNVVVEGGTVYCASYSAMRLRADSATKPVNVTVTGGEIIGTIEVQNPNSNVAGAGALTITDGKLSNSGTANVLFFFGFGGGADNIEVSVTGGEFTGVIKESASYPLGMDKNFISGGTFTVDVTDFCAEGFVCEANGDGTYGVVEELVAVAEIDGVGYATLADAFAAAQNDDVVTVIADVSGEAVTVDKNLTVTGAVTLTDVSITGATGVELTVSGLTFAGNSWINSNGAAKLTVSGVTANVQPSNASATNSRSAFVALGRSEQAELVLVIENSNIVVEGGGDPVLGWAAITEATLSGNTFGASNAYQTNSDSVKFMSIADGAVFNVTNNTVYSNYNGIVFGQNTTRGNAYTVNLSGNTFYGGADHIWVEVSGSKTCHATIVADSTNTVNGNVFTAADIKLHPNLNTFTGYMGVGVDTDAEGKLVGGTYVKAPAADLIADGYECVDNGNGTYSVVEELAAVAEIDGVGYATLADAFAAAQNGNKIVMVANTVVDASIVNTKTVTLDLNGKVITGIDNTSANFGLIDNRGTLTIKDSGDTGAMTLTSTVNSGWGRYAAVIANNPGGNLTVEGGTLENLGGTDMAYGIDNLTNGKGTSAVVTINGGTVKSPYRAVRQFLNGVEATNVLTVNGGTIEGANKAIWMQDPSTNANSGKLVVGEDAVIKGDVYLFVTAGSTEWPVEVSIAAEALADGEVITGNVPEGYEVKLENGTYGVSEVTYVAEVNGVKYTTLEDAFAAVQTGETITLLADVTVESDLANPAKGVYNIADGMDVTLDLNGKKITATDNSTGNFILFYNYGKFTVKNGTVELTATNNREWEAQSTIILNRGGETTIESGSYVHKGSTDMAITVDNSGNSFGDAYLTINGGEIKSTYTALRMRMADTTLNGEPGNGVSYVEMKGGILEGGSRGVWGQITNASALELGALTITGGTVKGGNQAINMGSDGHSNIAVAISGDTVVEGVVKGDTVDYAITGGTYTTDVNDYCADGFVCEANGDGTYGVEEIVVPVISGKISYRAYVNDSADREGVQVDLENLCASESVVVKLYDANGNLLTTTSLKAGGVTAEEYTVNIVLWGNPSGSWDTTIETTLTADNMPETIELWVDGQLMDTFANALGAGTNVDQTAKYLALDCVVKEDVTKISILATNMILGNDLSILFWYNAADFDGTDYFARVTKSYADGRADVVKDIPYDMWSPISYGSVTYVRPVFGDIAAKEMADDVCIQLFTNDGVAVSDTYTTTVRDYAMSVITGTGFKEKERIFAADMLNYGAAAQIQFNYNTGDLANSKFTENDGKLYETKETPTLTNNGKSDVGFLASSLNLESKLSMIMWFTYSAEYEYAVATFTDHYGTEKSVTINKDAFITSSSYVRIPVEVLAVADAREIVSIKVYNASGAVVASGQDSIESVAAREGGDLYIAIMKFADSAYKLFH